MSLLTERLLAEAEQTRRGGRWKLGTLTLTYSDARNILSEVRELRDELAKANKRCEALDRVRELAVILRELEATS